MKQTTHLGALAEIRLGHFFRTGIGELPEGDVNVIQTRDFAEVLDWERLATIQDPS